MNLYELEHYLFRLKNDSAMQQELVADPRTHLEAQSLDLETKQAILRKDIETLWQMGVHPLLLVPLSRFLGMPPPEYRARLKPFIGQRRFRSSFSKAEQS